MACTPKPVRRNGGYCTCADRLAGVAGICRYGRCTEFRCPECHGKLGGWGPIGCQCEGGPRWARYRGMQQPGYWDWAKDEYVRVHVAVKPSIARRKGKV